MNKTSMVILILVAPAIVGCLEVPTEVCSGTECFPLSNEVLQDFLSDPSAFDVISLAASETKLKVESTVTYSSEGQHGEIHWSVAKDDEANLRSVAMRLNLGTSSIDTEIIEGNSTTNVRVGNVWYEGRDEVPEFRNPFFELAEKATENPSGLWPSFGFDTTSIAELDWTITADVSSQQQIATGVNETHSIILEFRNMPPKLMGIELYGNDESSYVLNVFTGNEVEIELQNDLPLSSVQFSVGESVEMAEMTVWGGYVPWEFTSEINPSELSFHALVLNGSSESSVAEMNLADVEANLTDSNGSWWAFNWWDYSGDGWFSAGDFYEIRTNSTSEARIGIWDHWASSWSGELLLPSSN